MFFSEHCAAGQKNGFRSKIIRGRAFRGPGSLSKNLFTAKKLRRISATNGGNKVKSVIYGGVYVGNDTSHDGRGRAAVVKPPCRKSPLGVFDRLSGAAVFAAPDKLS